VPLNEKDQLSDVQHRVQLARKLFAEQGEFIRSVVRYATHNDEYIDDLVHELFLFFVAKPIPEDILNIRGYLYKVIHDKVTDWHRAQKRYKSKIQHYREIKEKEQAAVCRQTELHENAQQILDLIGKHLSRTEVRAILLRYQHQYAIEEVAKEMNIKSRSVSRYISVGLKKIRRFLNSQEGVNHEGE
jgi:RNA polymerase sigma factor (sigma-70 family)